MQELKIRLHDKAKTCSLISKVEQRAKVRLMQPYDHILIDIDKAEKRLKSLGIPKKYWVDCVVYISPNTVTMAYNYKADGTQMKLKYFPSGWFIVSCFRASVHKSSYGGYREAELLLSSVAYEQIPNSYML